MANFKTNAMRIIEKEKIPYNSYTYDASDGAIDGVSVAHKMGQDEKKVYKTLVTKGTGRDYYVFVIPVAKELDLKACARSVGEKSVEMIKVSDINKVTGYIRGGCSPIGMKKEYKTVIDSSCLELDTMIFSGGKIGFQVEMAPDALIRLVNADTADITV
ncbi:MAG: Cys-tRNA(Pro) deacylase [Clostridia bacterium]|nr:Cys-tRNA(Pro) deacylase [Clostridia bacterium]